MILCLFKRIAKIVIRLRGAQTDLSLRCSHTSEEAGLILRCVHVRCTQWQIPRGRYDQTTYSYIQARANSVDPDQTPQNAPSDQGLHSLPLIHFWSKMDLLKV